MASVAYLYNSMFILKIVSPKVKQSTPVHPKAVF